MPTLHPRCLSCTLVLLTGIAAHGQDIMRLQQTDSESTVAAHEQTGAFPMTTK